MTTTEQLTGMRTGYPVHPQRPSHLRVLLIEDFEDARETILDLLEALGYRVMAVEDGAQALRVNSIPDVIVCDIGLPDCSGCDLVIQLRSRPGWRNVPAVAISGFAEPEDLSDLERGEFYRFLPKPVSLRELDHVLQQAALVPA